MKNLPKHHPLTLIEIQIDSLITVKPINDLWKEKEKLKNPEKDVQCSMTSVNLLTPSIRTERNNKEEQFIKSIDIIHESTAKEMAQNISNVAIKFKKRR